MFTSVSVQGLIVLVIGVSHHSGKDRIFAGVQSRNDGLS